MSDKVSIIIPTYNRNEFFLPKAIKSALAQDYEDFEVIVVNDAGEDAQPVTDQFENDKLKYFQNEKNLGLGLTRNRGIEESTGNWFYFLDSDDRVYTYGTRVLLEAALKENKKVVYGNVFRAYQRKNWKGEYETVQRDLPYNIEFDRDLILIQNISPVNGFLVHRECFDNCGLFESAKRYEDWLAWLKMSRIYDFLHIQNIVAEFTWRLDGTSMSSTPDNLFSTLLPDIFLRFREYANPKVIEEQNKILVARGLPPLS
jgi:glycosyltransferase involved in cell wall biosynthesis